MPSDLQNTAKSVLALRRHNTAPSTGTPYYTTNFSNNNFYSSKGWLASTNWVLVGSLFNDNSAELLPLRDWRFAGLLNSTEDQPSKLITKKRYRSWSFKKSLTSFDRRKKLPFRKVVGAPLTKTNQRQPFNAYHRRFMNRRYFKLRIKSSSFLRWAALRSLCPQSVTRKIQRAWASTVSLKRRHLSRLRRLKKIRYRSTKLKARFVYSKLRTKRLNVRAYLRKRSRNQSINQNHPSRLNTTTLLQVPSSYSPLLRLRGIRRPLNQHLRKPLGRPYVRFRLTPLTKPRRFRRRGRRYRSLFQKNFSARSKSLIKSGLIVRMLRRVVRGQYKTRHLRLPPTDYTSGKLKKPGRWKHSYPYMFTNNVPANKKLGRSTVQNLALRALTPTRSKRQKRTKFNTYKRFAKLKTPRWVLFRSLNRTHTKNLATKVRSRAEVGSVREIALYGFRRWVGAVHQNTDKRRKTSASRKYTTTYQPSNPTHRPITRSTPTKYKLDVGRRRPLRIYYVNAVAVKTRNVKLRLRWLRTPARSTQYRLPVRTRQPNLTTLQTRRTSRTGQHRAKILDKSKGLMCLHRQTPLTPSPLLQIPVTIQTPLNSPTLTAPRYVVTSPRLQTRTNINFVLKPYLQFFNRLLLRNPGQPYAYKYMFKKKLYSFLYPNQVRNALLSRKKKITFYKLVYKTKLITRSRPFYWPRNLKKHLNLNECVRGINRTGSIFGSTSPSSPIKPIGNFKNQLHDVADENHFSFRGADNSFKTSEVRIPRIRFKPGYQRLWRQARTALKESLKLRFIYQKKLSRYIVRFFKQTNSYTFSQSEMSLEKTLMYSRLLPDLPTVNVFLQQNLVYLNGLPVTGAKASVFQNDLLQLIISKWYYVAYRWIANWTLKRHKKFKRLVYRKGLAGKHRVMKLRKQKSYYTPHWIYLARYDISDIKPYLEVDYMTLSVCVVYNPYILYYYSPDDTPDLRSTIYRLYNWKYIT